MTNYVKINGLWQAGQQSDYADAISHGVEFEYSAGDAQIIEQVVRVGTGYKALNMAHMATVENMLIENLDTVNSIYFYGYSEKLSRTYSGGELTFTDVGPGLSDTIADSSSKFQTDLVTIGDGLQVSGSAANDGVYLVWKVAFNLLTLSTALPLAATTRGDNATLTYIGIVTLTIPAGGSILTGRLKVISTYDDSIYFACPNGATTAKISYIGTAA